MTAFAFDRPWPRPASGCAVPYAVFTEQEVFAREQARIFRGPHWSFVGLAVEVPAPGDFKTTYVGPVPVILLDPEDRFRLVNQAAEQFRVGAQQTVRVLPQVEAELHGAHAADVGQRPLHRPDDVGHGDASESLARLRVTSARVEISVAPCSRPR